MAGGEAVGGFRVCAAEMSRRPPILLIVSERPELFSTVRPRDREVHLWRPHTPDGAVPVGDGLFAGDPTLPETYAAIASSAHEAVAVLDLDGPDRQAAAMRALQRVSPDTAFVVLSDREAPEIPEGVLARHVSWPELLRVDLEAELTRLDLRRRIDRLRRFAAGNAILPILVQDEPDPDAMASALAIRRLLRRRPATAPLVSLGRITRPENLRMAELLRLQVTQVTVAELQRFDRIVAVDMQPLMLEDVPVRLAVIDHHPVESGYTAEFMDIRAGYGATASLLTEYLRAGDERRISRRLATALLYGIQTDTANLSRGVSTSDVEAYAFLHRRADHALLRRIARPSHPVVAMRLLGRALSELEVDRDLAAAHFGAIAPEHVHLLADLADHCMSVEGVSWVAVGAEVEGELEIALRHQGTGPGAGHLARRLAGTEGLGGGHASMARVRLPAAEVRRRLRTGAGAARTRAGRLAALIRKALDDPV